jgi:hypothetical protein
MPQSPPIRCGCPDCGPEPPIDAGTPEKTDDLVLDMMHQMYDYLVVPLIRAQLDKETSRQGNK